MICVSLGYWLMFWFKQTRTSTFNFNVWLPVPIASFIILSFMTDLDLPFV